MTVQALESKFANMTKGQKLAMWDSLSQQHEASPKTMTIAEVASYQFLIHNLWYLI
jgi:hypothetical protein